MTWERAWEMMDTEFKSVLFRACGRNVSTPATCTWKLDRNGTLQLLRLEYLERVAARRDGTKPYRYSQFCALHGAWRSRSRPSLRIVHVMGSSSEFSIRGAALLSAPAEFRFVDA